MKTKVYGDYRSHDLCLAYMIALVAGELDVEINLKSLPSQSMPDSR